MIFDFSSQRSLENPQTPLNSDELADYIQSGSAYVNEASAMQLAAVYSCIYILSSSVAQLPLHVMRKSGNGIEAAKDHPAYYILHDSANDWQSSYDWRETKQAHVAGWGNAYTQIVRSRRTGEIKELRPSKPWETNLIQNGNRWIYSANQQDFGLQAIAPENMIHIRAIGSDGRMGKSPIKQHAETIGLGISALNYGNKFFAGGGKPTGLVSVKGHLNNDSWERLKEAWQNAMQKLKGEENRTLMLPMDLDYKSLTIPPEEAQFLETRKFNRSEIAGIFNVPAHMINDLEKATFSNISEQAIQFVRHTIMPWVVKWEQEINRKLFSDFERKAGFYVKFNLAGLLRGTPKERAEFYHFGITDGWMNRNEARVFEDMNPVNGLDEFLVSVNASQPSAQHEEPPNE